MIHHGDCLEIMPTLPAESVDSIVTDPPYGLSFMGKNWDHGIPGVPFWSEAFRVAKPGTHLLAFGGTRTFHRLTCAIEDAGWEIRDCIMWVYGSGFPKSHNLSGDWQGWGTALKPAWEPIIVARKPLTGTVAQNVQEYGTGALNVDGCRIGGELSPSIRRREAAKVSGKSGGDMHSQHRIKLGLNPYNKDNGLYCTPRPGEQLGRWPANLIHDGSDEVTVMFAGTEKLARPGKRNKGHDDYSPGAKKNCYDGGYKGHKRSRVERHFDDTGSAARFFYCAKASKADRDEGNHHPTVKPTDLMRYLCRLVTPPGGIVFDPFCGSGSTGKAARLEGFQFIGIEREVEYVEIARHRIAAATNDMPLLECAVK